MLAIAVASLVLSWRERWILSFFYTRRRNRIPQLQTEFGALYPSFASYRSHALLAYFSLAPFIGAFLSLVMFSGVLNMLF